MQKSLPSVLRSGAAALIAAASIPVFASGPVVEPPAEASQLGAPHAPRSATAIRDQFGVSVQRIAISKAAPANGELSPADSSFVKDAATSGHFEVAAGKLAAERGQSAAIKSLGKMLVDDHTAANQELADIAKARGATVPDAPSAEQQDQLARLREVAPERFDQAFASIAGAMAHRKAIELFEKAAVHANDPALREFAKSKLPALKKHLEAARNSGGSADEPDRKTTDDGKSEK